VIPLDLPVGARVSLPCTVQAIHEGEFAGQLHVFLDDVGLREIVLHVRGTAQAPETPARSD
jgi:hypothetical protein